MRGIIDTAPPARPRPARARLPPPDASVDGALRVCNKGGLTLVGSHAFGGIPPEPVSERRNHLSQPSDLRKHQYAMVRGIGKCY
jgi:hypothetical protein